MSFQALALALWITSFGLPVAAVEAGGESTARAVKSSPLSATVSGQRKTAPGGLVCSAPRLE